MIVAGCVPVIGGTTKALQNPTVLRRSPAAAFVTQRPKLAPQALQFRDALFHVTDSHGARADPGCLELSLAQDPARVGSRDVPASHCGEPLRHRTRASDHGMGGDAGNRAPARRRRGGLSQRGFRSVCIYKEAVRGAEENSSLETTEHHPLSHRVPPWIDL
jgi:hypothetical protein